MTEDANAGAAAAAEPWSAGAAWIDGRYCPVEEAKISVLDLGVTRSDCTYDVVHSSLGGRDHAGDRSRRQASRNGQARPPDRTAPRPLLGPP